MSNKRVLVVGTTADYIEIINQRFPQKALFITDFNERAKASEAAPDQQDELLCNLSEPEEIVAALRKHLSQYDMQLSGITCFDCESMPLAGILGDVFGLCYPSGQTIAKCRDKYVCREIWREAKLACPDVRLVHNACDAIDFLKKTNRPAVLKPLTGSGSELISLCSTEEECLAGFNILKSGLASHADSRMYAPYIFEGKKTDPRKVFLIEEFIQGAEYSCDFTIDGDEVEIIRIARKIPDSDQAFGTTLAYLLPVNLPEGLDNNILGNQLHRAAKSLGIDRAICMMDFIVCDNKAFFIELAPRPGGDCLPPLLLKSCGVDILGFAIDFAQGQRLDCGKSLQWGRLAGVRLFAKQGGIIERIDSSALAGDHRVTEYYLKRSPGHKVVLPPENYDSRLLGHVIFKPTECKSIENECVEIAYKLKIKMKKKLCTTASPS